MVHINENKEKKWTEQYFIYKKEVQSRVKYFTIFIVFFFIISIFFAFLIRELDDNLKIFLLIFVIVVLSLICISIFVTGRMLRKKFGFICKSCGKNLDENFEEILEKGQCDKCKHVVF